MTHDSEERNFRAGMEMAENLWRAKRGIPAPIQRRHTAVEETAISASQDENSGKAMMEYIRGLQEQYRKLTGESFCNDSGVATMGNYLGGLQKAV
ncbi:MAG: hypothetical protein KGJ06_08605, partial [Pseudomonadota bacterium]|nr:hypothetical protein [Pseudomonadota bacterium]